MLAIIVCTSPAEAAPPKIDSRDRSTAVALNYCKASFRRIQRYPSKRVLLEEREKILDNLNLNGIADQEVINLYGAVLDEIAQVQIADKEKKVFKEKHKRAFRRQAAASVFAMGTQFATAQYVSAMRTGASSWWDYRSMGWHRDVDMWKIERQRMVAVVDKSGNFLDTFWKMARDKNIPDRWLVRDNDLDKLEEAMRENDPVVRLRILKRMERFMECYPPYWYYVGRTQQALGQLFAAAATYDKVADLGTGHFRKDELLATSLGNRAVIQDYLGQPSAPRTAREALGYASTVWEVNLMCAGILYKNGQVEAAEDAILRNIDVDLEKKWSGTFLTWLYLDSKQDGKLAKRLAVEANVRDLPAPLLLQSALRLGTKRTPSKVFSRLQETFYVWPALHFGPDDLVLSSTSIWGIAHAKPTLLFRGRALSQPRFSVQREGHTEARFERIFEWGGPLSRVPESTVLAVRLDYPGMPQVNLHVRKIRRGITTGPEVPFKKSNEQDRTDKLPPRQVIFELVAFDVGRTRITLKPGKALPPLAVTEKLSEKPQDEPAAITPTTLKPKAEPVTKETIAPDPPAEEADEETAPETAVVPDQPETDD